MKITTDILIALAEKYDYGSIDFCNNYGEPGYSKEHDLILFGNWNPYPKHVISAIEKQYDTEWNDEWIIDHDRSLAYRTSPDCYSWTPSFIFTEDGEVFTQLDVDVYPEGYINMIKNDPTKIAMFKLDLDKLGFKLLETEGEYGWHDTNDDPKVMMEDLEKQYPHHDIIFCGLSKEQFRTTWKVAIRPIP